MYFSHAYKLSFSIAIEHYCYLRMSQRTTKDSKTYTQLKKTITKVISSSDSEFALFETNSSHIVFNHFVDDDIEEIDIFQNLIEFLHVHYFFRLT